MLFLKSPVAGHLLLPVAFQYSNRVFQPVPFFLLVRGRCAVEQGEGEEGYFAIGDNK